MAPTTNTKGIVVGFADAATDNGDRPVPPGTAIWASPNVRLATGTDLDTLRNNPASWETIPWDGTVAVDTNYTLLVRLRNSDAVERHNLNMQAWVADFTAGGVGPASAILHDPSQPASDTNTVVSFSAFGGLNTVLPAIDPANPGDPTKMVVLHSNEIWKPNATQIAVNGGHVCVAVNTFAEADDGSGEGGGDGGGDGGDGGGDGGGGVILLAGVATPQDGEPLVNGFISPTDDRKQAQRNIMIVLRAAGTTETRTVMIQVPAADRCPLMAEVTVKPVKFGDEGALGRVPELVDAARRHTGGHMGMPGYPTQECMGVGRRGEGHHHNEKLRIKLDPGERVDLELKFRPAKGEKAGDVHTFDVLTEDLANHKLFGAARVFVMVTDGGGGVG
jgi:hypothetical protein